MMLTIIIVLVLTFALAIVSSFLNEFLIPIVVEHTCAGASCSNQVILELLTFCLIRLVSYRFEKLFVTKFMADCNVALKYSGLHNGSPLGFPYLIRKLLTANTKVSQQMQMIIVFVSTSIAFYPYVKDMLRLMHLIYNGLQRRHYTTNLAIISSIASIYLYFTIIFIELLDVSLGVFCEKQTLIGVNLLFPNVNFPIVLFFLHLLILSYHKQMPTIIYEINDEDKFIQLNRRRCLTNKDCHQRSTAIELEAVPSKTTTIQRRSMDGRIIQLRSSRDLDPLVPCKIKKLSIDRMVKQSVNIAQMTIK